MPRSKHRAYKLSVVDFTSLNKPFDDVHVLVSKVHTGSSSSIAEPTPMQPASLLEWPSGLEQSLKDRNKGAASGVYFDSESNVSQTFFVREYHPRGCTRRGTGWRGRHRHY